LTRGDLAVSIFLKDQWKDWAREWGLAHVPEKGWIHRTERVVGERKNLLIRVAWGTDQDPGLFVTVRFPRVADTARLRQTLIDDPSLDVMPGKGSARRKMEIESAKKAVRIAARPDYTLTDTCLVWRRTFAFRIPKAAQIQSWVDALVGAVARATPVFEGRCETCATGLARSYVLVDGLPIMMCASCQQRLRVEGEMAERSYDMIEVRHLPGAALGLVAALVGAVAWAAIAAVTERIFVVAALGIGGLVAFAYRRGAGRVDAAGRAIASALTLVSVVLGEVLLLTWWISRSNPEIGFNPDAGWYAYLLTWQKAPGQEVVILFLGLVGAWFATQALQRPKLKATIETTSDGPHEQKRAA